jgi:hemoglobin
MRVCARREGSWMFQPQEKIRRSEEAEMAHKDDTGSPAQPTLYDRLGGVYNIAPVIDHLIDRIMVDPRLNANPRVDEAHHRVSAAGFKYFVTEMLCEAAGGPQRYSGRPMGDSHRHLMITEEEWLAFMDDLQQTLDKFGVPQPEQNEIKAIVESTHEAIVVAALQEGY